MTDRRPSREQAGGPLAARGLAWGWQAPVSALLLAGWVAFLLWMALR